MQLPVIQVSRESDNGAAANFSEPIAPSTEANIICKIHSMYVCIHMSENAYAHNVCMYCICMYV